jgi:hypothetical protein
VGFHKYGKIDLDDLVTSKKYDPLKAHGQSNAFELDGRLEKEGSSVICIPCHPGYSSTNLQSAGVGIWREELAFSWP